MRRYLDDFFHQELNKGAFVISADMGNFPQARKHKNFIDVGNNESSVGGLAISLRDIGKTVYIYDVCGYIMRNSYSSFIHSYNPLAEGNIIIYGWGSGFAYDGCLDGHYPFDDINMATMFGFDVHNYTANEVNNEEFYNEEFYNSVGNVYVRMYDIDEYYELNHTPCENPKIHIFAEGWLLYEVDKFLNSSCNEITKLCSVSSIIENDSIIVTDQYTTSKFGTSSMVCAPHPYIHYRNKKDFVDDVIVNQMMNLVEYKNIEG